ncbi:hypothetical protein JCM5296_000992 [Sporobolomyces johnsonii]
MLPNPPLAGGSGAAFHRPAPLQPVPPQPRPAAKHVIDLSDDSDDGAYASASTAKRRRTTAGGRAAAAIADKGAGGKGKGKARDDTWLPESDARANSKLREDAWRLDDDGDMLIFDEFDSPQPKAGTSADNGNYGATGKRAALPWAVGGSSKAAARADDALDEAVATILAIIPDVVPTYVRDLLRMPLCGPGNVELVIEALLNDDQYPKKDEAGGSNAKGKGKEREVEATPEAFEEEDDAEVQRQAKVWLDSSTRKPLGKVYEDAALAQLYLDFDSISQVNLKRLFQSNSSFYAPTYVAAEKALKQTDAERGFKLMLGSRAAKGKGKGKVCEDLEKEKQWVAEGLVRLRAADDRAARLAKQLEEEIASGAYFECGCCFSDTAISQLVICSEGCQFCKDCAVMNAESQIGMRKYILPCMSTSGCSATFPESEIAKCLPPKSLHALHKIRQEKEVDLAELEGLEKCPFCPFAYIIENDQERLFHCQREDCGIKDHLPKTCKEVSEDAKVDSIHRIEEAMSAALIRRCPKPGCNEPYIKEAGTCNKITCSSCRTLSCYICNKIIEGYQHFKNAGSNAAWTEPGANCVLWEDSDQRVFQEVEAARIAAEKLAREHPGVSDEDLKKLAMDQPPPPPAVVAHLPAPVVGAYQAVAGPVPRGYAPLPNRGRVAAAPPAAVAAARRAPPVPPARAPFVPPPGRPPPAPPVPAVPALQATQHYSYSDVKAMYRPAYEAAYRRNAVYAPYLDQWAADAALKAYMAWDHARREAERQRPAQEAQEARKRVRAMEAMQERLLVEGARRTEAERRRVEEERRARKTMQEHLAADAARRNEAVRRTLDEERRARKAKEDEREARRRRTSGKGR